MTISPQGLEKFKKLYLKHYGIELSEQELLTKAMQTLNFFSVLSKPIPKRDESILVSLSKAK